LTSVIVAALWGFVEAQEEYANEIHDDSGVNQYAQRIISTLENTMGCFGKMKMEPPADLLPKQLRRRSKEGIRPTNKNSPHSTVITSRF
jgi:hypothetical protein